MRAKQFITEKQKRLSAGKVLPTHKAASPGAMTALNADRYYGLYRASMLMGRYPEALDDIDSESMMGNKFFIGTYTNEEKEMYIAACEALGIDCTEMIKGPSAEPEDTNTQSAIQPFKGYPR